METVGGENGARRERGMEMVGGENSARRVRGVETVGGENGGRRERERGGSRDVLLREERGE